MRGEPVVSFKLPNGQTIWHLPGTAPEVLFMYKEIVKDGVYLRHGVEVGDGNIVLDVGANIGMFTMSLLASRARLRVLCVEPVPQTRECLEKNIAAARCQSESKIDIIACALGAKDGSAEMTFLPGSPANSTLYPELKRKELDGMAEAHGPGDSAAGRFDGDARLHEVSKIPKPLMRVLFQKLFERQMRVHCAMARLSSLIRSEDLPRIDLLKIDVEGAELEVLRGIDESHWPLIRQVALECAVWNKPHLPALEQDLRQRGFGTFAVEAYASGGSVHDSTQPCLVYARR